MRRFDASPRRATPKGHNLHHLHSTASKESAIATPSLRSWRTQDHDSPGQSRIRQKCPTGPRPEPSG
jgi:hypothetical protein